MPRQKNDGRGRLGGRQAGTPNKDNPLKQLLSKHSLDYFTPSIDANTIPDLKDDIGNTLPQYRDKTLSPYELDCFRMKAADRAKLEVDLLAYHTPKMQSVSADMTIKDANRSWSDLLTRLADGEPPDPPSN